MAAVCPRYVIDTNFGASPDPTLVATRHVRAIGAAGLWDVVSGVEVGNEVDIYAKSDPQEQRLKGHRNSTCESSPSVAGQTAPRL